MWIWLAFVACKGDSQVATTDLACEDWDRSDSANTYVATDGDDSTDGNPVSPVKTFDAALELWRTRGGAIRFGAGYFDIGVSFDAEESDMTIPGCPSDMPVLRAAVTGSPVVLVDGAINFEMDNLAFEDGSPGILIEGGADVTMQNVEVRGAAAAGVLGRGVGTRVEIHESVIRDIDAGDNGYGAGVAAIGIELQLEDVMIERTTGVATVVTQTIADLTYLGIVDTAPLSDGTMGRGLVLQDHSSGTVRYSEITGSADAGLFISDPGTLTLQENVIDGVDGSEIPSLGISTGDGIVVAGGTSLVTMLSNVVRNATRIGMLVDNADIVVDQNVAGSDNGVVDGGNSMFMQNGASITGSDPFVELPEDSEYTIGFTIPADPVGGGEETDTSTAPIESTCGAPTETNVCTVDLDVGTISCTDGDDATGVSADPSAREMTLSLDMASWTQVRFDAITSSPTGDVLNIGNSPTNNGGGGDQNSFSNDSEAQIIDTDWLVYPSSDGGVIDTTVDEDAVASASDNVTVTVCDGVIHFESAQVRRERVSDLLFQIDGDEPDTEAAGGVNDTVLWAGLNRTIGDATRTGNGLETVTITFGR